MNPWSNIEVAFDDPEIVQIDAFQSKLGKLSRQVIQIRELITRHEVCHFKYQSHIRKIKTSIEILKTEVEPADIGKNHIQHGSGAWKNDSSGRSLKGQQYIHALKNWMDENTHEQDPEALDVNLRQNVQEKLGIRDGEKVRLVRLLLARLTWDWDSLKKLQHGGAFEELEMQIIRMDICHYAFPENLDALLSGIGGLKPVEGFEGCGSYNPVIVKYVKSELSALDEMLKSHLLEKAGQTDRMKAWLNACLMKTLKEQLGLPEPDINLS